MKKKHFISLANALIKGVDYSSRNIGGELYISWSDLLDALIEFCYESSDRFNEERFKDYLRSRSIVIAHAEQQEAA